MSDPSRRLRRHFTAASQRRFQRDGKRGGAYVARASGRHYCLGETSVLAESSDVYGVLQSSQVLLQVHGAKNACHYQASGWMMQRFGALAAQRRIGGCILGVTPAEDTLCSMAIGYARAEDEPAFDVPALTVSMTQAIRRHLARRLPDYMLPQHITLIPEIPLSNNGKVDTSRLPKVVKHSECLAPRSDDEIRMRRLWAELLDKREERIGCDQSFFTQGGIRFWLCDWYARSASRREPRCVWKTSTTTIRFRKWRRGSPGNLVATAEKKGRCNDVDGFIEQPEKITFYCGPKRTIGWVFLSTRISALMPI